MAKPKPTQAPTGLQDPSDTPRPAEVEDTESLTFAGAAKRLQESDQEEPSMVKDGPDGRPDATGGQEPPAPQG